MMYREPLRCKICDRMMQGGDDHYCIPCVEHLEAVIDVLKERNSEQEKTIYGLQAIVRLDETELAALTAERDALAGLVREIANAELGRYPQFYLYLVSEWKDKAKALLDYPNAPPDAKPEMVLVRRSDLAGLFNGEFGNKAIQAEIIDRLKAALGGEK